MEKIRNKNKVASEMESVAILHKNNGHLLPSLSRHNEFTRTMSSVFHFARWFGMPSPGAMSATWSIFIFALLVTIEAAAIVKVYRAMTNVAIDVQGSRSLVGRLSGAIFYMNAIISTVLLWRFSISWKSLFLYWNKTQMNTSTLILTDDALKMRLLFVVYFVGTCSVVEHSLGMMSATGFDCPPEEYFRAYILSSHGFLLRADQYSLWFAIPIFFSSKAATCIWNFQDTIIILMSMGLTSRYRKLNERLKLFTEQAIEDKSDFKDKNQDIILFQTWRRLREAYAKQSSLVRRVSNELGPLILLSNLSNFYFICLQLFLGVGNEKPHLIDRVYYTLSTFWLCFRAGGVVLIGSNVNVHSQQGLRYIYSCPESCYNIEARRLEKQLSREFVALSGLGFFHLDRAMILKVAAAILTYELVLIQYESV